MLWSIDSCQNRVSADQYHLTVWRAQVSTHRGRVFFLSINDIWNKSYINYGNKTKMKKRSSQWTQFMQLRKEAWKKIRTSTGFEPLTSRLPVRCSTNWGMKPLTLGVGQLWVHMFPWKKWHDPLHCCWCVYEPPPPKGGRVIGMWWSGSDCSPCAKFVIEFGINDFNFLNKEGFHFIRQFRFLIDRRVRSSVSPLIRIFFAAKKKLRWLLLLFWLSMVNEVMMQWRICIKHH